MIALRTSSMSVISGMILFLLSVSVMIKCLRLKNNRKLHSLLLPLNLNLNYENLFVFGAKVLLLFQLTKFFTKKMRFLPIFHIFRPLKWLQMPPKHAL